jgi:hypothetical protein
MQPERDKRSEQLEPIKRRVQQVYKAKPDLWHGVAGTVAGFWVSSSLVFLNHYYSPFWDYLPFWGHIDYVSVIFPEKSLVFGFTVCCGILSVVAGKQFWAALGQAVLAVLTGSSPD